MTEVKSDNKIRMTDQAAAAADRESFSLIERTKNEWEAVSDALRQIILLLDEHGRVIRANRAVERWGLGTVGEAPGKSLHDLIHRDCQRIDCPLLDIWTKALERLNEGEAHVVSLPDPSLGRFIRIEFRPVAGSEHVPQEKWTSFAIGIIDDITASKTAEDSLRQSEEKFFKAFRHNPASMAISRIDDGGFVEVNDAMAQLFGYSRYEIIGYTSLELGIWADPADRQEMIGLLQTQGAARNRQYRFRTRSGSLLDCQYSAELVEIGRERFLLSTLIDQTQLKQTEVRLRQNRNMLAKILNSVPMSIFWKDRSSTYLGCNQVFADEVGLPEPEKIVGLTDYQLPWAENSAELYRADDQEVIRGGVPKRRFVEPVCKSDGSQIWADISKVPLTDESGQVIGILGLYSDISERVRAEDQIRQMTAELKTIVQALPDQFWRLDRQGTILALNIDFNVPPDKFAVLMPGENLYVHLPEALAARIRQAIDRAHGSKSLVKLDYELPVNGETQIFEARFLPLPRDQVFVLNRNITEQMRLESIAQSVDLMNNFGYIFSGIRHEIGNPINSIKMTVSVLKNQIDRYNKDMILEYIERILSEIARVEYLLKSLKTFNMFERQKPKMMDIVPFVNDFLALIDRDFDGKGIDIVAELDEASGQACFDPHALHQVMLNIFGNAADALQERLNRRIEIQVNRRKERMEIVVADNGCGMTPAQLANLFKPFFTSKQNGTGLGLVIVKKLLTQMEGTIDVDSQKGEGTRVLITLPLNEGAKTP